MMLTRGKCDLEKLHSICSTCVGIIEEEEECVVLHLNYPKSFAVSYALWMIENKMFKMYLEMIETNINGS